MGVFSRRATTDGFDEVAARLFAKEGFQEALHADTLVLVKPLDGFDVEVEPFDMFAASVRSTSGAGVLYLPRLLWDRVYEEDGMRYLSARVTTRTVMSHIESDIADGVSIPIPQDDEDRASGIRSFLMGDSWAVMIVLPD